MHKRGHIGAALGAYAPLGFLTTAIAGVEIGVLGGVAAAGISMLPDYDQRIPFIDHRGPTHTIRFAVAVGVALAVAGLFAGLSYGILGAVGGLLFGFFLGTGTMLSHIGADALTPAGVEPFEDGRHYSYGIVRAANPIANYLLFGVGVGVALLGIVFGAAL